MGQTQLGERVRAARTEARLSQAALAHLLDLAHPQSISNYERGITEIPTERLRQIAEATKKPMSFFVDEHPGAQPGELIALREEVAEIRKMVEQLLQRDMPRGRRARAVGD